MFIQGESCINVGSVLCVSLDSDLLSPLQPCQTIYQVFHDAVSRLIQYGVLYVAEVSFTCCPAAKCQNKVFRLKWNRDWKCLYLTEFSSKCSEPCVCVCARARLLLCVSVYSSRRTRRSWPPAPPRSHGLRSSLSPCRGGVMRRTRTATLQRSRGTATSK